MPEHMRFGHSLRTFAEVAAIACGAIVLHSLVIRAGVSYMNARFVGATGWPVVSALVLTLAAASSVPLASAFLYGLKRERELGFDVLALAWIVAGFAVKATLGGPYAETWHSSLPGSWAECRGWLAVASAFGLVPALLTLYGQRRRQRAARVARGVITE